MSMKRYPSYKSSGLSWLGSIPTHWKVLRLKQACDAFPSNVDKHVREGEVSVRLCNYTDVYYNDRIVSGMGFMAASASQEQIARFSLQRGDTIITKDSETANDIAISAYVPDDLPGVVCGYHLSIVRPKHGAYGAFVKRLFDSHYAKARFAVAANGLTRVGLSQYALDNVEFPFPPYSEQVAIANFLDRETAKIDALISEQEKLNSLLTEKRHAAISEAITKGRNPCARTRHSGVKWLGEIPAHWNVVPLMHLTEPARPIMYGIVLPGPDVETGIPIVKGGDVKPDRLRVELLNRTTVEIEAPYARARLKPRDIVYSIRGTIGDAELVPDELENANITQDVARISPASDIQSEWLLQVMKSRPVFVQLEQRSLGAAVRGINIFELKRARIPVPPRHEREEIAAYLQREITELEGLRRKAMQAIELLVERRSALITAAVTGQIDVRHTQAASAKVTAALPA